MMKMYGLLQLTKSNGLILVDMMFELELFDYMYLVIEQFVINVYQ